MIFSYTEEKLDKSKQWKCIWFWISYLLVWILTYEIFYGMPLVGLFRSEIDKSILDCVVRATLVNCGKPILPFLCFDLWDSSSNGLFSLVLIVVWNLFQDEWKFFQKCHKISILLYLCLVNVFHEIYLFHSRKIILKDFNFVTFYCCFLNLTKRYKNCWSQLMLNKFVDYTFIIIQWLPLMLCLQL